MTNKLVLEHTRSKLELERQEITLHASVRLFCGQTNSTDVHMSVYV